MITDIDAQCEHVLHENGIHELILKEFGIRGTDAYFLQLERLYQNWTNLDEPLRIMLNSAGGSLPISYAMQRGKELSAKYPKLGRIYTATLTDNAMEAHIVDTFLRLVHFKGTQVRFFENRDRDQAIEWLLKQK